MPTTASNASENVTALRLFVRAARTGSFSRASRELGLSQPTASRIVATLEKELGVGLFTRSTRAVTLTEAGNEYLARVAPILDALTEANHAVSGSTTLIGTLRVGMSSSFAFREIIPRLPKFTALHPALRLELQMNDRRQDLVLDGVDVAIRLGPLPDSSAVARKITSLQRIIAASPAYLEANGVPDSPSELAFHQVISGPTGTSGGWSFTKGGQTASVKLKSQLSVSVNEGAVAAAVAGLGIVCTGMSYALPEVAQGTLVRLLPDWEMEPIVVHAVYAGGSSAKPAARIFTEFLGSEFKGGGREAPMASSPAAAPSLSAANAALAGRWSHRVDAPTDVA
jgi:DNA-binding transcriptional LysR family regulator